MGRNCGQVEFLEAASYSGLAWEAGGAEPPNPEGRGRQGKDSEGAKVFLGTANVTGETFFFSRSSIFQVFEEIDLTGKLKIQCSSQKGSKFASIKNIFKRSAKHLNPKASKVPWSLLLDLQWIACLILNRLLKSKNMQKYQAATERAKTLENITLKPSKPPSKTCEEGEKTRKPL